MKKNPYDILGLTKSASKREIVMAKVAAIKKKQFPLNEIAEAEKALLDPQKRITADFLLPILPTIQRFKSEDLSLLNTKLPKLEFLSEFDGLEEAIAKTSQVSESDIEIGKTLVVSLKESRSDELESSTLETSNSKTIDLATKKKQKKLISKLNKPSDIESIPTAELSLEDSIDSGNQTVLFVDQTNNQEISTIGKSYFLGFISLIGFLILGYIISKNKEPNVAVIPSQEVNQDESKSQKNLNPAISFNSSMEKSNEVQDTNTFKFPIDSCGDTPQTTRNAWYPVFVNFSDRTLSQIKSNYCRDAISKYRKDIGVQSIQVASFLNLEKAEEFASAMREEVGSGEVGKPTIYLPEEEKISTANKIELTGFPKQSCGDNISNTNSWYPVYVDYSDQNLSTIQNSFCRDAIRNYRESIGKDSIQVASFGNQADAEEFARIMRNTVGSGQVGEP